MAAGYDVPEPLPSSSTLGGIHPDVLDDDEATGNSVKEREERQHRQYCQLFGNAPATPPVAWERLASGEVACHVSRMIFSTATQCVNHRAKKKYLTALAAARIAEDAALIQELEAQAQQERESLRLHKQELVKKRNAAKKDLAMEASRLTKANRRLEHDLLQARRKIEKMQLQHDRQVDHMRLVHRQLITKLVRKLEDQAASMGFAMTEQLNVDELLQGMEAAYPAPVPGSMDPRLAPPGYVGVLSQERRPSQLENTSPYSAELSSRDRWAATELDTLAGLQAQGLKPLTGPILDPSEDPAQLYACIPEEVMDAWYSVSIP